MIYVRLLNENVLNYRSLLLGLKAAENVNDHSFLLLLTQLLENRWRGVQSQEVFKQMLVSRVILHTNFDERL